MKYMIFDTETTGLPRDYNAPTSAVENWPRMVQIAWVVADGDGNVARRESHIIKPDGFSIPRDAVRVHGITTEMAMRDGVELGPVLGAVVADIQEADVLVAHNVQFDEKILGAELIRAGRPDLVCKKKRVCTMRSSTEHCRIPGHRGYKWPTLEQLHRKLFGSGFVGAHDALADVEACAKCYFELRRLGVSL